MFPIVHKNLNNQPVNKDVELNGHCRIVHRERICAKICRFYRRNLVDCDSQWRSKRWQRRWWRWCRRLWRERTGIAFDRMAAAFIWTWHQLSWARPLRRGVVFFGVKNRKRRKEKTTGVRRRKVHKNRQAYNSSGTKQASTVLALHPTIKYLKRDG